MAKFEAEAAMLGIFWTHPWRSSLLAVSCLQGFLMAAAVFHLLAAMGLRGSCGW